MGKLQDRAATRDPQRTRHDRPITRWPTARSGRPTPKPLASRQTPTGKAVSTRARALSSHPPTVLCWPFTRIRPLAAGQTAGASPSIRCGRCPCPGWPRGPALDTARGAKDTPAGGDALAAHGVRGGEVLPTIHSRRLPPSF